MRRRMLMGKKEPITVTLYGADNDTITISEGSTTLQSVTLSGASRKATIANGEGTYTFKSANTSYSTTVAVVNGSSVNVGTTYTISITLKGANNDNIRIRRTGVSDKWVTLSGTSGSVSYSMVGQSSGSMAFYSSVSGYSVTATVGNGNTITLYPSTAIYWYGNTFGRTISFTTQNLNTNVGDTYSLIKNAQNINFKFYHDSFCFNASSGEWQSTFPAMWCTISCDKTTADALSKCAVSGNYNLEFWGQSSRAPVCWLGGAIGAETGDTLSSYYGDESHFGNSYQELENVTSGTSISFTLNKNDYTICDDTSSGASRGFYRYSSGLVYIGLMSSLQKDDEVGGSGVCNLTGTMEATIYAIY